MSKSLHVIAACLQVATALIITGTSANAQSPAVVFQGLGHTAVGGASLRLDASLGALDVSALNPAGGSGVAVALGEATSWTARFGAVAYRALPLNVSWSANADGQRISTASMRQVGGNFQVRATFTGATTPTYSAQVYNDERLVGAIGGLPPTAHIDLSGFTFCETLSEICRLVAEFHNTENGACEWKLASGSKKVGFVLPNGVTLTGNELRLVEEVHPAGHYSYQMFDEVVMQSNAYAFALFSETVR